MIVSDAVSGAGQRTGAKTTPKKARTTIVPRCFRLKRQTRHKCFHLCRCWSFLVRRRPSSAVPAVEHYCVQAAMNSRCALPKELQECAAV